MLMIISVVIMSFSDVFADETDLPIHSQGIKERQYTKTAITDIYNIEMFTKNSSGYQKEISKQQENSSKTLSKTFFDGEKVIKSDLYQNIEYENIETKLFLSTKIHNDQTLDSKGFNKQKLIICISFLLLALISFLASLAFRKYKRGK